MDDKPSLNMAWSGHVTYLNFGSYILIFGSYKGRQIVYTVRIYQVLAVGWQSTA